MLQKYEKKTRPPYFGSPIFLIFCIVNNPSLFVNKGMLLCNKGMLLRNKGMLLPAGSYAESRKCGKRTLSSS